MLETRNEERFIAACLENLLKQEIEVYLIDSGSTDQTIAIAERYLDRGLIRIEAIPEAGVFSLRAQLERKERLASSLDADWLMHVDADEIRLPPRSRETLKQALQQAEAQGYNAVNFLEFTFIPTQEAPEHDHPDFQETMRWYYPFLPSYPHRLNAWKRQPGPVELAWSGGHQVRFPGLRIYPTSFPMRHYLFLSIPHAIRKWANKRFDAQELEYGWHGWRGKLKPEMLKLPTQAELRTYVSDDQLDYSKPWTKHYLECLVTAYETKVG
jgi:glycosyltransferase involved in cell wall biosynthesis